MANDGHEKSPLSDSLAANESGLGIENLNDRLLRYAGGKNRALDMAKYITDYHTGKGKVGGNPLLYRANKRLAGNLRACASYLVFKNYYNVNQVRLYAFTACRKHLLCPFCAMRRGAKYLQAYYERLQVILAEQPSERPLKAYMVTLTVKDGANLWERYSALRNALKRYQQRRRDALKGQGMVEYAKATGGVMSSEVRRGKGSGSWHPHVHMVWLCEQKPDARQLSKEWLEVTGDSYIVDVRELYGDSVIDGFLEVFKYALKFSDMELSDNWHAYETLQGKRMVESFGLFRGVEVPDNLTDDELADEPYLLMLYRFVKNAGYSFVGQGDEQSIVDLLND